MKRFRRCVFAVAVAAAGVAGVQQQPAGALSAGVLLGGGGMAGISGPGITGVPVTGTISGTVVGTFGSCGFSGPFSGFESIVQGQGGGAPFGCFPSGPCDFSYQRVVHEIIMQGFCSFGGGTFQVSGFAEPNSAAPTTSYLYQVAGTHSVFGPIAINGNMAFTPGAPVGVNAGTLLPAPTTVTLSGTITGILGPGLSLASCGLSMTGVGNESFLTGSSNLTGVCNSPWGPTNCNITWTHIATQVVINGNCSGPLGFQLVGTGEIVIGDGGGYTLVAAIAVA